MIEVQRKYVYKNYDIINQYINGSDTATNQYLRPIRALNLNVYSVEH